MNRFNTVTMALPENGMIKKIWVATAAGLRVEATENQLNEVVELKSF